MNAGDTAWMLTSTCLVLLMTVPGVALLYGGMIGLVLGGVINFFISTFSRLKATMSLESFVLAFIFSVLVGILFGLQPARKATLMNPVQALR